MQLRIPGPTPCPEEVLKAMARQMINHRGKEFGDIIQRVTARLKMFYQTKNDVFILTGSGTGAMETAIVNTLSPGDKVLSASNGVFGDRFADIAETYGAKVSRLKFEWGTAVDPDAIRKGLKDDPSVKAVLVTHNETSTGVTNDLQAMAKAVKEADKLLIIDAISSLSSIDVKTDAWQCDVVATGSQKGWMVPPGLSMISISERGWKAYEASKMPKYYWDLKKARSYLEKAQTPWTPAVSVFYALDVAFDMLAKEGLANIFARHARVAKMTRDGVKALGLSLFSDEAHASNTVTAVKVPDGMDVKKLMQVLREEHKVVLSGGQSTLEGKIFRIGHLGWVYENDIKEVLEALKSALPKAGYVKAR